MSLKICYIINTTNNCGPVNVLLSLVRGIKQQFKENEISIIVLKDDNSTSSKKKDFLNQGIEIIKINSIPELLRYIKKKNFDIIHSHGLIPDTINFLLKTFHISVNSLNVTTLHNYPFEDYILTYGKLKGYLMAQWQNFLARKLEGIACSKSIKQKMLVHGTNVYYIQNGVPFPKNISFNKNKYKNFIFIGEINKRKNVEFLLEYFMDHTEYIFTILGDGPDYSGLKNMTQDYNNIMWLGRKENIIPYLKKSDVFISSSLSEGMPMAILEALSYGKPVILSDILSHKEIYDEIHDGIWLFKNNSIESLETTINNYYCSFIDSKLIYEESKEKFSEQMMANKYYKYYMSKLQGEI